MIIETERGKWYILRSGSRGKTNILIRQIKDFQKSIFRIVFIATIAANHETVNVRDAIYAELFAPGDGAHVNSARALEKTGP